MQSCEPVAGGGAPSPAKGEGKSSCAKEQQKNPSALKEELSVASTSSEFVESTSSDYTLDSDSDDSMEAEDIGTNNQAKVGDSKGHGYGLCRPCIFFLIRGSCTNGAACTFCHACNRDRFKATGLAAGRRNLVSL
mmetsp:Transcript_11655/g.32912  ORF Transcript_11655/g.32912 Transcript_11655/m.32912 type:complete len:135 (+) Transcript_11655:123-527(+)